MAKKQKSISSWLQTTTVRLTRVHFAYIAFYLASLIIFDSWNLYTHEAVGQLWTAGAVFLVVNAILWFASRLKSKNQWYYIAVVLVLLAADIAFASYNVWWQHGLASKALMLYAVPIVASAALRSRSILLATTTVSAAAYSMVAVRFFFRNYGLGYRVELWGTVGFYSAMFFVLALLLMVVIRPTEEKF
jgi:hypothetical protein